MELCHLLPHHLKALQSCGVTFTRAARRFREDDPSTSELGLVTQSPRRWSEGAWQRAKEVDSATAVGTGPGRGDISGIQRPAFCLGEVRLEAKGSSKDCNLPQT